MLAGDTSTGSIAVVASGSLLFSGADLLLTVSISTIALINKLQEVINILYQSETEDR